MSLDLRTQAQCWSDTAPGGINPFADGDFIDVDEPVVPHRAEARAAIPHAFKRASDQEWYLVGEPVRTAYLMTMRTDLIFNIGMVVHQWWAPWMAAGPLNPTLDAPHQLTSSGAELRTTPAWHPAEIVSCMGLCVIKYAGSWHREQVYRLHMPPHIDNGITHPLWDGPMELVPARYLRKPSRPILSTWADQPAQPHFWEPYITAVTCPYLRVESYPGIVPNFLTMELVPAAPLRAVPNPTGSLVCLLFDPEDVPPANGDDAQTRQNEDFMRRMREIEIDFGPGNDPVRQAHSYVAYRPIIDRPNGFPLPAVTIKPFCTFMLAVRNVILPPHELDVPTAAYSTTTNSMDLESESSFTSSAEGGGENAILP